jgi:hypothetical protein
MTAKICAPLFAALTITVFSITQARLAIGDDLNRPRVADAAAVNATASDSSNRDLSNDITRPAHLVVLRVSASMLAADMNRDVDGQRAVSDVILGTPIRGVARLTGRLRVDPVPSPDKACFNAVFNGAIYCRTTGFSEGVTVHSHSITNFTASKEFVFDPERGFFSEPTKIAARTQCYTDGINPGRGGLIGRIVQRRASERVNAERPQITAIIRQKAINRINQRFDEFMGTELARLNKAVEVQTRLAKLRTGAGVRKLLARTTPTSIEIADALLQSEGRLAPLDLPAADQSGYPIELWIHGSLVPEKISQALKTVFTSPDKSALLQALKAWPGPLATEATAAITSLVTENKIAVQEVGDWMVVDINTPRPTTEVAKVTGPPTSSR